MKGVSDLEGKLDVSSFFPFSFFSFCSFPKGIVYANCKKKKKIKERNTEGHGGKKPKFTEIFPYK